MSGTRRSANTERWLGRGADLPVTDIGVADKGGLVWFDDASDPRAYRVLRRAHRIVEVLREVGVRGEASVRRQHGRYTVAVEVTTDGGAFVVSGSPNTWGRSLDTLGQRLSLVVQLNGGRPHVSSTWLYPRTEPEQFKAELLNAMMSALAAPVWDETVNRPGVYSKVGRAEVFESSLTLDIDLPHIGHIMASIDMDTGSVGRLVQVVNYDNYLPGEGAFGMFLRERLQTALGVSESETEVTGPFVRMLAARTRALAAIE